MPSVEISSQTFARLQAHAVPLVDNIETVIGRLIDFYESRAGSSDPSAEDPASKIRRFNPDSPPQLTHTKVIAVEFAGSALPHGDANWNGLVNTAVRFAKAHAKSSDDLKQLLALPFKEGRKVDEGYRFLSDAEISIQGQDANGAWKAVRHIARKLNVQLRVTFVWREKDGAAFPGITGSLSIPVRG